jgi:hypothetical protein
MISQVITHSLFYWLGVILFIELIEDGEDDRFIVVAGLLWPLLTLKIIWIRITGRGDTL